MLEVMKKEVEQMDYFQSKARQYVKWRIDLDMWEGEELGEMICDWIGNNLDIEEDGFEVELDKFWKVVEGLKDKVRHI